MRKYIALIATLIFMTVGLDAQVGRRTGMTSGIKAYINTTDFDSIHVGAGKFVYGASGVGTAVTSTGDEMNYLDITTLGIGAASKAVVLTAGGAYHWPAADTLYWSVMHDGTTALTATGVDMNYLDLTALGTGAVSKAVVLDASGAYHWPSADTLYYSVFNDGTNALTATAAEMNYLDLTALGTGAVSKAVVLDANGAYHWPAADTLYYGVFNDGTDPITATGAELNYLDVATQGIGVVSKAVTLSAGGAYHWPAADTLYYSVLHDGTNPITSTASQLNALPATTAIAAELDYNAGVTAGTGVADKVMTLDVGDDFTWPATGLLNYWGTQVTSTGAELNYLDITTQGIGAVDKAVTLSAGGAYHWPAADTLYWSVIHDGTTALTSTALEMNALDGVAATLTAAELNYNDIATLGTQEASKVVITDAASNSGVSKVTELWIGSSSAEVQVLSTAAELDMRALTVKMIDVSSAGQVHVVSPYAGDVTAVYSVLNATIATAPAGITIKDKDGNVMGTITIADGGSGPGDVDSDVSIANADVAVGDMIEIETDNASTNAVEVEFTILIAIQ